MMKKILKWVIIAVVGLMVLGAIAGKDKDGGSTSTKQEGKKEYKMNQAVKVGNLDYMVVGVSKAKSVGNEYVKETAKGEFLIIKVKVTNNDKEGRIMDTNMFKLVEADGTTYDAHSMATMQKNNNAGFFLENVNPKLTAEGYVVFDVAKADASNFKLQVSAGFGSATEELISLTEK